jgi:carbamoylphosphate synthase large subunit
MEFDIDVFIPRDSRMFTREAAIELEKNNICVMMMKNKQSHIVSDKMLLAEYAGKMGINVPICHVVNNVSAFKDAVDGIMARGKEVCFKPRRGLGGRGFRIIREYDELETMLYGYQGASITYQTALRILGEKESFDDLLVMNYLGGVEYSVDCLSWQGEAMAIVPRRKVEYAQLGSYSVQCLEGNEEIMELSRALIKEFALDYISNIQFRYSRGKPHLIEINRRMSGGIGMASMARGEFSLFGP